jgi:hypothetical protein
MTALNVIEGLGDEWLAPLQARIPSDGWLELPVALDGRMLAHEWIRVGDRYVKTDNTDHYDDHFFPGCQDIAWDVAAAVLELDLSPEERRYFVGRYRSLSGDGAIAARLPHHALFYLAFRLGYTGLASSVLGKTSDGVRFARAARHYGRLLRREVSDRSGERWNA